MTLQDWQDSLKYVRTLHEGSKLANLPYSAHRACQESASKLTGYFQHELKRSQERSQKRSKVVELRDASTGENIQTQQGS